MKKYVQTITSECRQSWRQYVMQSLLAAFVIFIMFLFLNMNRSLIVVSIGATAFIVFAMPDNVTAHPKNVIGGHLIGFIVGFLLSLIPYYSFLFSVLVYSFAIGFSIFFMVVLNMEHPPASATALGVAMNGFSWKVSLVFFISIIVLIIVQRYFKQHLHCLVYSQKK